MKLSEYINSVDFNIISVYQKDRNMAKPYVFNNGDFYTLNGEKRNHSLSESSEEFKHKVTFQVDKCSAKPFIKKYNELHNSHGWHPANEKIELKNGENITGTIYCNFFLKEFYNETGIGLDFSPEYIQDIYILISQNGFQIVPYVFNNKPQPIYKEFEFPKSFMYNTNFGCIESQIPLNFTSDNDKMWRLEIESEHYPSEKQIERIKNFINNKYSIKREILDNLLNYYNSTARFDFELPEITSVDTLKYFLNEGGIYIPNSEEDTITIFINTWDEEHGSTFYFNDKTNELSEG